MEEVGKHMRDEGRYLRYEFSEMSKLATTDN